MKDSSGASAVRDPLYEALVKYEDAANDVGALTICASGAYAKLTDAIRGYGNLEDARYRFAMEAALLSDAHDQWKKAVAALGAQVADGVAWQAWFSQPRRRCPQCGNVEVWANRWTHAAGCNECWADGAERAPLAGNPFEEVARQGYGERGVIATEDI